MRPISGRKEQALADWISIVSEVDYAAGWKTGIEFELWEAIHSDKEVSQLRATTHKHLCEISAEIGGWIVWCYEANEERFVDLAEWEALVKARQMLSPAEVSKRFGIPLSTLSHLRNTTTTGPKFTKACTGKITYLAADVEAWLAIPKPKRVPGWMNKGLAR